MFMVQAVFLFLLHHLSSERQSYFSNLCHVLTNELEAYKDFMPLIVRIFCLSWAVEIDGVGVFSLWEKDSLGNKFFRVQWNFFVTKKMLKCKKRFKCFKTKNLVWLAIRAICFCISFTISPFLREFMAL